MATTVEARRFADLPAPLQAAVMAYDEARRTSHGSSEPPMSETNMLTLAPMIMAACWAYIETTAHQMGVEVARPS